MEAKRLPESAPPAFQLSLRVRHPSVDPADLSREFMIEAEHSFRAGTPRRSATGVESVAAHSESYWLGVLKPSGTVIDVSFPGHAGSEWAQEQLTAVRNSLSGQLSLTTSRFLRTHAELLRRLRTEGGEIALLVTISSSEVNSFTLPAETSQLFGEMGVSLEFELAGE